MELDQWLGVELRHFAALQAIAEEGTFGRAATRLGYTQSAVSQQIATLERIVGVQLLERPGGPRPVTVTDAGELLLRHARGIVARLQAARADLETLATGEGGSLRIGTFQSVGAKILPTLLRRFTAEWPKVEVTLFEGDDELLLDRVESGDLDLTFFVMPTGARPLESFELLRDPYVAVVGRESEWAGRDRFRLRDLRTQRLVGYTEESHCQIGLEAALRGRGVEPRYVFRSNDNRTVQSFAEGGVGVAIMPRLALEPSDEAIILETEPRLPPRLIVIAWHKDRYHSPAAQAFVELARLHCAELEGSVVEPFALTAMR
jgi:DNA-binding transcriptional LysR family regulator